VPAREGAIEKETTGYVYLSGNSKNKKYYHNQTKIYHNKLPDQSDAMSL
jgi:hypothetical protein